MRISTLSTLLIATVFLISSCNSIAKVTENSMLEKSWTHSTEESSEQFELYRPSDSKEFPMSRYRQVFVFKANNVCEYLTLAPTDAHRMEKGTWEMNDKTNIIKIYDADSKVIYEFKVIEIKEDLLKLKAIN